MEEENREKTKELYWNLVAQGDENDAVRIAREYLNRPGELSEKVDALIRDWNEKGSETLSNKIRLAQAIAFMGGRRLSDVQTYDAIHRIMASLEEKCVKNRTFCAGQLSFTQRMATPSESRTASPPHTGQNAGI